MLALVQRVGAARVEVAGEVVGAIGQGLLVFVCAEPHDTPAQATQLVDKLLGLRVFADDAGKMNRDLHSVAGGLLLVSQFTLAAATHRGHRPSFGGAAPAGMARELFDTVLRLSRARHPQVACGVFGADMQVHLVNDGPVTIPLSIQP